MCRGCPVTVLAIASHMRGMETSSSICTRRLPTQHRATKIDAVVLQHLGRTYDNYYPEGVFTRYADPVSMVKESFPITECVLVEEFDSTGALTKNFEILPELEFNALYVTGGGYPTMEYEIFCNGTHTVWGSSSSLQNAITALLRERTKAESKNTGSRYELRVRQESYDDSKPWEVVG